ncbi:MAG: FAD-dependent oxidoreductase [Alphaproteobacteria bacterium]|jgi:NADPH-dependent glutamate synthase beta subunit-like oxidoreductase/NAD(P)H-flavin reductase|nr:FAD-dependent oxidoreductase [Alphaproteobacteria bacterium]MBT4082876.1 FAD-dependent oxidoreductase [Alphaproteobacteria bacterium]MBT7745221.1 FAD-dependent oxidoreductase [Alphaproteobacteria bacterium]
MSEMDLGFDLEFSDLYALEGLQKIDAKFENFLTGRDAALAAQLAAARDELPDAKTESTLLTDLGPHLEAFIADMFGIGEELGELDDCHIALKPFFQFKRLFIQRKVFKAVSAEAAAQLDGDALAAELQTLFGQTFAGAEDETVYFEKVSAWQEDATTNAAALEIATNYAGWALRTPEGRARHAVGHLFKVPEKLDFERLVPAEVDRTSDYAVHKLPDKRLHRRDGFGLTDAGADLAGALSEAHYCIFCHNQGKDSCSKGMTEKPAGKGAAAEERPAFSKSHFGVSLAGCPLGVRISEMNQLKIEGVSIGALAALVVENPMTAGTGHRICNDCMKSCIYQKQDPVEIPEIETRILKDVLALPYGFEIYSLLTRWNPLNLKRPLPLPPTGHRVLVAGMGPAGYTLAHHLVNDGHTVVGIDGAKIEPLSAELSGVDAHGNRVPFRAIKDIEELEESLDDRVMAGFGGVAEYGITVRWDKNFLKILRLLVARRQQFALFGAVRFGGTLTVDNAFDKGFDHVALAVGAGRPTMIPIPRGLVRGVRAASDFLMALQLTGAAKTNSIANMQLRMPVVVVGGGLTAIDTATEALAYYPVQVEKFLGRYEALVKERGEDQVRAAWDAEETLIANEFIDHAKMIRAERAVAEMEGREARVLELMKKWGGVTVAYRKRLIDSPSYTLNHEEVEKALEEGIYIAECLSPISALVDEWGHVSHLTLNKQRLTRDGKWMTLDNVEKLPARAVLIAAGTRPNTVLAREDENRFELDGRFFQAYDLAGVPVEPEREKKPKDVHVLAHIEEDGRAVSFFGDLHPSFAGNVVGAMGSALQGYPVVSQLLAKSPPVNTDTDEQFLGKLNDEMRAVVHSVERLNETIIEVIVRAPQAARQFQPGQFYRLQNFETLAPMLEGTRMAMEGLALTGAWVDREEGLISLIVLEMGGSSSLCAHLQPGEPVVLMGPTGAPTEIPEGETVLLAGGGLGNAVLFSIGQAMRAAGSKVLYFAGYKTAADRYKISEIEAAADVIIWCCDEAPGFAPTRPQDKTYVGNIIDAMVNYAEGNLGEAPIPMTDVDRAVVIGSHGMMGAVADALRTSLMPHIKDCFQAIASINSPMQCMMKEICAQCVQTHVNQETGEQTLVFSCFNQDQPLEQVNFSLLGARLKQNSVQEKLTAQWIDKCLSSGAHEGV